MNRNGLTLIGLLIAPVFFCSRAGAAEMPTSKTFTNSIGMEFARIEPGVFTRGAGQLPLAFEIARLDFRCDGDFDEYPKTEITISQPFYLSTYETTNQQYEQFREEHKHQRGRLSFSKEDDEAVVFVNWFEASAFCEWLSKREGLPYRLPTEAEWEYACRAGTNTNYFEGEHLQTPLYAQRARISWYPDLTRSKGSHVVSLRIGQTPPNAWGLFDMHGNVEEWCSDWYGPYTESDSRDPVGPVDGNFRVTRGGSHNTELYYLRSANRMGTIPEDRSWVIGFRVALGPLPKTTPVPTPKPERYRQNVCQDVPTDLAKGPDPKVPYFKGPRKYVKIPLHSIGPRFSRHNHDPALVECPNGDLLAIWYSCVEEPGRELGLLASRLRYGTEEWDEASVFWNAPDRNDHAPALWFDGNQTLFHFCGLSAAATFGNLATILRTSTDNGVTWSRARLILPKHRTGQMPIESVFQMRDGTIVLPCDAVTAGHGGTAIHLSTDGGETWKTATGRIAGIHAGVVELQDGRLLALGRGDSIDGKMPLSISGDRGDTWEYSASPFPPISSGQRLVLTRLHEGPLFFASFANEPLLITDVSGKQRGIRGLYTALSYDDGKTWSIRRPVSDDGPPHPVETTDGSAFVMDANNGEPRGYLSVCQTADGVIQLIGSRNHYAFNLAWLEATPPEPHHVSSSPPEAKELLISASLSTVMNPKHPGFCDSADWSFTGSGADEKKFLMQPGDVLHLDTGPEQRVRWASTSECAFSGADSEKGVTAEIEFQVLENSTKERGADFEVYLGDGSPMGERYFITVTRDAVYWYEGVYSLLADGLENGDRMHTFRMAIRHDKAVQIYRDGVLLGVRHCFYGFDPAAQAQGPYIQWGDGASNTEMDIRIGSVAYDIRGPLQPASGM